MDKIKENESKQKNENFDETKVVDELSDIIKNKKIVSKENINKTAENSEIKKHKDEIKVEEQKQNIIKEAERVVSDTIKKEEKNQKEAEYKVVNDNKKEKNKKKKTWLRVLLTIIILTLIGVILSTVFSLINLNNTKLMRGIYVNGTDISNLSKQEAINKLNDSINGDSNVITVYRNGVTDTIQLSEIGGSFDAEKIVEEAYKIGREGNIVKCNYDIMFAQLFKKKIKANLNYDEELFEKRLEKTSLKMPDVALNASYVIDGDKLIIKSSTAGYKIKKDEFENKMKEAFSTGEKSFEIPTEKVDRQEIDIDKIYKEVYKQPVNAYYTKEPQAIYKEEKGLDFAITLDEAKKIIQEDKEEYEIPLKELEPSIKVKDLDDGAFPNLLATFTTYYGTGDTGRCHNIYLAAKSITQTVVMPGETFSYNNLIGECSPRTGYRESTIYLNGELSTGIGGGICQVSTTLYNAVVRANLEIVQRRNHSLSVTYVPLGQDAMVSIGSSDFQFKNNRDYPIKVVAYTGTGSITCQIYGLKNDVEYDVKLVTNVISKTDTKTKTQTYKILYQNGKEVSRTLLSTDTYKMH